MDLDFSNIVDGRLQRRIALEDDLGSGHCDRVVLTVWVPPRDSWPATEAAARAAGIALLDRALKALRGS